MLKLSYEYNQNSSALKVDGIPDVTIGDSVDTIGILSLWSLQIIGSPLLEGKKEHLEKLMQVVFKYSRYYVSGVRKTFASSGNNVVISPFNNKHKLLLKSTQKNTKPLEIILDDSELSDLTRCLDLLRFDHRINIRWNIDNDLPLKKGEISRNSVNLKKFLPSFYAFIIFILTSSIFILMPIGNYNENLENQTKILNPTDIDE